MARRHLSIPPATHEQGWWPTPRWALRRLAMYAIAALSGGLLVVLCAALLSVFSPREIPTSPAIPSESRPPTSPPDTVIPTSPLISQATANVKLVAFRKLLENQDKNPKAVTDFIDTLGLEYKYPFGFALFYSNGKKILYYGNPNSSGVSFDPSKLQIARQGDLFCMSVLHITIRALHINMKDVCVQGAGLLTRMEGVDIDIETIARSSEGAAWIIGARPAQ